MQKHFVHQTKNQLRHKISRDVNVRVNLNWLGSLNDENKLQVDKRNNKNCKKQSKIINYPQKSKSKLRYAPMAKF